MSAEIQLTTHSAGETRQLGVTLGKLVANGSVILLRGSLGAGKTQFAKGVADGLGVVERVTSPTFSLVNEYEGLHPFVHMDLYRLYPPEADVSASPIDLSQSVLASISFEEFLEGDAVVLIEWPQGVRSYIDDAIDVQIDVAPMPRVDERIIRVNAIGKKQLATIQEWVKLWMFS